MDHDFNRLKQCRYGKMLFNVNDQVIGRSLEVYGEYSEFEMEMLGRFLRRGDTAVDLGANIGAHALFFARQVGPSGQVIAFEPQRIIFQTLCANLALNSLTHVWALPVGASDREGMARLPPMDYSRPDNFGAVSLDGSEEGEAVRLRTVDSLELPACALLKLDVEGMESKALEGARSTIERCRPLLYVENHNSHNAEQLVAQIQSYGYRVYWHLPALFNPGNFGKEPRDMFPQWFSVNILCVHEDSKEALEICESLRPALGAEVNARLGTPEVSRVLAPFSREHVSRLAGLTRIFDAEEVQRRQQRRAYARAASPRPSVA